MRELQNDLADLEQSLRSASKNETADFFASLLQGLCNGNKRESVKALDQLAGSAAIMQYAAFTNEQESLFLRILQKARQIRDSH